MNDFKKFLSEDRRLCILRILKDAEGSANDSIIHMALEALGHRNMTRAMIHADIDFLIKRGLVADEWMDHIQIVSLKTRGVDVALGRVEVAGIKKPAIGG